MTSYIVQGAGAALKQTHIWEQKHDDIEELYILNDALIDSVRDAIDPDAQFELVAPLIEAIGDSADILSQEYIGLCSGETAVRSTAKTKVESSLRKVYMAIHTFNKKAADARNVAHLIVKKVKRQLEQVIANFVEFVTLSLDRIMQKQDIEELNAHHASIALMLHSATKTGQGA
jgi:hypothetical protein